MGQMARAPNSQQVQPTFGLGLGLGLGLCLLCPLPVSVFLDSTSITPITRAQVHHHDPKGSTDYKRWLSPHQYNPTLTPRIPAQSQKQRGPNQEALLPENIYNHVPGYRRSHKANSGSSRK
ncbi:hypothetical protein FJTKL_11653 [Diaporthe vaccinii]|uniref:Uncharacterized protein n=1 Tax=Diaporthe vaccinii TaxID=105482 RepID=A0ABR4EGD4_9PEZI